MWWQLQDKRQWKLLSTIMAEEVVEDVCHEIGISVVDSLLIFFTHTIEVE